MRYVFGDYTLDIQRRELRCRWRAVPLGAQVFDLLVYLVTHHDRAVSKQELHTQLWPALHVSPATLSAGIKRVRQAVGDSGEAQRVIQTLHGRGYRFVAPLTMPDDAPVVSLLPTQPLLTAERKVVTVLVCAFAAAPTPAEPLGAEALHSLRQALLARAVEAVQQYGGTLQRLLEDGFVALFGTPVAYEDHALRAVLTATRLPQHCFPSSAAAARLTGQARALRIGVHTGPVVAGPVGDPQWLTVTAVGDTLQLAMQLQQQATPGTTLLSAATLQRVQDAVQVVVWQPPSGAAARAVPVAYELRAVRPQRAPLEARLGRVRSRFVGRQHEFAMMQTLWAQVERGHGQVVGVVGHPGIGKSRLLYEVQQHLGHTRATALHGRCVAYGSTTPYLPLLDLLRHSCQITATDPPAVVAGKVHQHLQALGMLPATWAPYVLPLLGVTPVPDPLTTCSPQVVRARTVDTFVQMYLHHSRQHPLLLAIEDLHWIDASSEACLAALVDRLAVVPILFLVTARPGYRPPWMGQSYVTQMVLQPLSPSESRTVLQAALGPTALPQALLHAMVRKAEGNPFFLEEFARVAVAHPGQVAALPVPETVQAVLAARLDRLSPEAKHLVQTAAVIGYTVPLPVLQGITELSEEALQRTLAHLQTAEFLSETRVGPEITYTFRHALTQEVAYQSLLTSTRQQVHQRIAQVFVEHFAELVETQPVLVAQHYTAAGRSEWAMPYWQRAGQQALQRSATPEAIDHLTKGLALLQTLPDTPARAQRELDMQLTLGTALRIAKGYAASEVGQALARARELCRQVRGTPQRIGALWGVGVFYQQRGELQTARELFAQCLTLAEAHHDPVFRVKAHVQMGVCLFFLGEIVSAQTQLAQARACWAPQHDRSLAFSQSQDDLVQRLSYGAQALWILGYPDQTLAHIHEMLPQTRGASHAFTRGRTLVYVGALHQFRREGAAAQERAEAALALMTEHGVGHLLGSVTCIQGWALAAQGQGEAGIALMHQGLAAEQRTGSVLGRSLFLAMLADAYGANGQAEEGLRLLAEALAHVDHTGERFWEAEVYRLKGELLLRVVPHGPQAETCFQQALAVARQQQAKSWELRAAMSLSRLWQQHGKHTEARELLAPIYGWFTEGFDTADLQDAKALLEELAG